jgi:hypothetical protein
MKGFKLRIYYTGGVHKGQLNHEEYFDTLEDMDDRYNELFNYENYSCNPTAWELKGGQYYRLSGY